MNANTIKPQQLLYLMMIISALMLCCRGNSQTEKPAAHRALHSSEFVKIPFITLAVDTIVAPNAPNAITRNIIEDTRGNIWFATFTGIIMYDGESFRQITDGVSEDRFFSILEDRNGNFWFGSIGGGVYFFDGESFQHFTTADGLVDDRVPTIYEDKNGDLWFGTLAGLSHYDGSTFQNYTTDHGLHNSDVNSIIEDLSGKYWLGTRGAAFTYDDQAFTTILTQDGQTFQNVRRILEDTKGNIWLGGNDGLWRYDGHEFKNYTSDFVGYIYEDRSGNIWTSSQGAGAPGWALSRYEAMALDDHVPTAYYMKTGEGMFFGIIEDSNNNMWVGSLNGVYRYDGSGFEFFKR